MKSARGLSGLNLCELADPIAIFNPKFAVQDRENRRSAQFHEPNFPRYAFEWTARPTGPIASTRATKTTPIY